MPDLRLRVEPQARWMTAKSACTAAERRKSRQVQRQSPFRGERIIMEQLPKIVQRHLQGTAKPGVHPDPDLLAAFAEKSLNDRERSQVLQHLADCADCRDVVSLAMPEIESTLAPGAESSRWLSWPVLRWGALAACVVVVSAAVTLHYERRQGGGTFVAEKIPAAPATLTPEN